MQQMSDEVLLGRKVPPLPAILPYLRPMSHLRFKHEIDEVKCDKSQLRQKTDGT